MKEKIHLVSIECVIFKELLATINLYYSNRKYKPQNKNYAIQRSSQILHNIISVFGLVDFLQTAVNRFNKFSKKTNSSSYLISVFNVSMSAVQKQFQTLKIIVLDQLRYCPKAQTSSHQVHIRVLYRIKKLPKLSTVFALHNFMISLESQQQQ